MIPQRLKTLRSRGALVGALSALAALTACGKPKADEPAAPQQAGHAQHTAPQAVPSEGPQMVHVRDEEAMRLGVTYGRAEMRPLFKTIRTVGSIAVDETKMRWFTPKIGGWVEKLYVNFTGDIVRRGQPLFALYSPELVTAQEELILATNLQRSLSASAIPEVRGGADTLLNSARQRLLYWDISEDQIRAIEESGQPRKVLTLHSPWTGVVMEKKVLEGSNIMPGEQLYMIADLSEVWVETEFYEADMSVIREAMPVEVTVTAYPGEVFHGHVQYVYPTVQEMTRTMKARIALPNPRLRLKPGMYATAKIDVQLEERALLVPASAVIQTGERSVVFVAAPDGMLIPRNVRAEHITDEWVHVVEGLEAGERVVTSATFLIDSESNLGAAMASMAGMEMGERPKADAAGPSDTTTAAAHQGHGAN